LIVTDAFTSGDVFNVFDNSTLLGTTSAATVGANCGSDPAVCSTDASTSHGTFNLGAGAHSITIVPTVASQRGAAYFRVDAPGGGGPGTCTLTQTATFSGGTLTLSYTIATSAPANWNIWLIAGGNALPLVNTPLPGISSATTLSFNVPNFPSLGTIGFLTTLTATPGGITCSDFDLVNT
jgi:hypothetical protein